jgi:hypothetical protein
MSRINKEQAVDLDLILQMLTKRKQSNAESVDTINNILFPNKSREYCLSLFYKLADYSPRLLYPENDLDEDTFWATEYVPAFLHDGGFTALYENEAKKQESEAEKERLSLEKLQYDVKNSKRIFKTYWWTFGISILSLSLALGKIIFDLIVKK